jgi:hypothetical protein
VWLSASTWIFAPKESLLDSISTLWPTVVRSLVLYALTFFDLCYRPSHQSKPTQWPGEPQGLSSPMPSLFVPTSSLTSASSQSSFQPTSIYFWRCVARGASVSESECWPATFSRCPVPHSVSSPPCLPPDRPTALVSPPPSPRPQLPSKWT